MSGFSISRFSVFTSESTDVDFLYDRPDGSQCKHTATCQPGGTDVSNTQCGGAKSVSWRIPDYSNVDNCDLGISSIGFDCTPGKTTVPGGSVPSGSMPGGSFPSGSMPGGSIPSG